MENEVVLCLVCDKRLELPDYVKKGMYEGEVKCPHCAGLLYVKMNEGKLEKYRVADADHIKVVGEGDGTRKFYDFKAAIEKLAKKPAKAEIRVMKPSERQRKPNGRS